MLTFSSLLYWCFLQICILSFFYQFSLFLFTFLPLDPLESIKSPGTKVVPLTKKLYGFTGNFVVMLFKLFSLFSYFSWILLLLIVEVSITNDISNHIIKYYQYFELLHYIYQSFMNIIDITLACNGRFRIIAIP